MFEIKIHSYPRSVDNFKNISIIKIKMYSYSYSKYDLKNISNHIHINVQCTNLNHFKDKDKYIFFLIQSTILKTFLIIFLFLFKVRS
ncbi:hypothetical protein Yalta_177 [Yalta virus]|nr:hypothetical protein Yalta_001 [Yalta virus]QKE44624.1 hypothetical protein Yalta_177 [Yalta virus]